MADRVAKCPRCKNKELEIVEVTENVGFTDPAEVRIVDGQLVPPSPFTFVPGSILSVRLRCPACKHDWNPRKSVAWVPDL